MLSTFHGKEWYKVHATCSKYTIISSEILELFCLSIHLCLEWGGCATGGEREPNRGEGRAKC